MTRGIVVSSTVAAWVGLVNLTFGVPLTGANALVLYSTSTNAVSLVMDELLSRGTGLRVLHESGYGAAVRAATRRLGTARFVKTQLLGLLDLFVTLSLSLVAAQSITPDRARQRNWRMALLWPSRRARSLPTATCCA